VTPEFIEFNFAAMRGLSESLIMPIDFSAFVLSDLLRSFTSIVAQRSVLLQSQRDATEVRPKNKYGLHRFHLFIYIFKSVESVKSAVFLSFESKTRAGWLLLVNPPH
jgi:hypothetical protein